MRGDAQAQPEPGRVEQELGGVLPPVGGLPPGQPAQEPAILLPPPAAALGVLGRPGPRAEQGVLGGAGPVRVNALGKTSGSIQRSLLWFTGVLWSLDPVNISHATSTNQGASQRWINCPGNDPNCPGGILQEG